MTPAQAPNAQRLTPRLPAEWEPLEAVWVVPPHNPETWPGCLEAAQGQHRAWREAMGEVVRVRTPGELGIVTNDSWVRDSGPLFVWGRDGHGEDAELRVVDLRFNAWGGKYEPFDDDDALASRLAAALGLPCDRYEAVVEGGALETDGRGLLLTTPECLLNPSRNGPTGRAEVERLLGGALGVTRTIWLDLPEGGLPGDDTDGHIDNAARFVGPATVVVHPDVDAAPLRGAGLSVVKLPQPETIYYDYPPDRFGPGGRLPLPTSYANFLIANGRVFVPTFGQASDDEALELFDRIMPDHTPVPVRSEHLVVGLGALHCLSMQQPAGHPA